MKQHLTFAILLLLIAGGALAFRLPQLGIRPMHADEAVQASIFRKLWLQGTYAYNPNEYHGPTLPYATLPVVWSTGAQSFSKTTEANYRIVPVLFGAGVILLFGLLHDAVGKAAALCAGVLTAISPAMVFYSRYYIHETLFVFFTVATIATAWRYVRSGRLVWCAAAGACAGLMQSTKETSVLTFAAMALALGLSAVWNRAAPPTEKTPPRLRRWHLAVGAAAFLLVTVTLLSSFFTNPRGPIDGVLTYVHWIQRAGGASPHVQPWYFFLEILAYWRSPDGPFWSEGFILALALVGIVATGLPTSRRCVSTRSRVDAPIRPVAATLARAWESVNHALASAATVEKDTSAFAPSQGAPFRRWLAICTILLVGAYTILPYKTPWCLLSFHQGLILLAGVGVVAVFPRAASLPQAARILLQWFVIAVFTAFSGHLAWQAHRASFVLHADADNPYVHTPTAPKIGVLINDLDQLAEAAPDGYAVDVQVIWHDPYYWPLPWYLRKFERVRYPIAIPDNPGVPIVISSPQLDAALTEKLDATHLMTSYYALRPNVLVQLWVRMDLWEAHLRRLGRL